MNIHWQQSGRTWWSAGTPVDCHRIVRVKCISSVDFRSTAGQVYRPRYASPHTVRKNSRRQVESQLILWPDGQGKKADQFMVDTRLADGVGHSRLVQLAGRTDTVGRQNRPLQPRSISNGRHTVRTKSSLTNSSMLRIQLSRWSAAVAMRSVCWNCQNSIRSSKKVLTIFWYLKKFGIYKRHPNIPLAVLYRHWR